MAVGVCQTEETEIEYPSENGSLVVSWPETDFGEVFVTQCPCGNITELPVSATRLCDGSLIAWASPNVSECQELSFVHCIISMVTSSIPTPHSLYLDDDNSACHCQTHGGLYSRMYSHIIRTSLNSNSLNTYLTYRIIALF
jgi:hypothetical protein